MQLRRFVLAVLILGSGRSAGADTFPVTTFSDAPDAVPGDHACDIGGGPCSLRAAVMEVNALRFTMPGVEHLVTLPAGVYALEIAGRDEDAAATGDLDFHNFVTIRGAGVPEAACPTACTWTPGEPTVIDARGNDRAIHVLAAKVTLDNLVIRGGDVPSSPFFDVTVSGGGILNVADLQLSNVVLQGNTAEQGGGLMNEGTAALVGVSVLGNQAQGTFGAQCGGGISSRGVLTLADALVAENDATYSTGGGLCLQGTATVRDTLVRDNGARFGGGISVPSGLVHGSTTLQDVRVRNNRGRGIGGGIFNEGQLSLLRATVLRNDALNYTDCGRAGCGSAGGIANYGRLAAVDTTIRENRAEVDGGGLWNAPGGVSELSGTLLQGNLAGNDGAGVFAGGGTVDVLNATFSGNRANRYGGGIHAQDTGEANVRHATFTHNYGFAAGGALRTLGTGSIKVKASVVTLNGGGNCRSDPLGGIVSEGYNVENFTYCPFTNGTDRRDADVRLDPALSDNGGRTFTHALFAGSAAIDLVPTAQCTVPPLDTDPLTSDQRGQPRPQGAGCDAGAYEATPFLLPVRFFCCDSLFFRIEIRLSASIALSQDMGAAMKAAGSEDGAQKAAALAGQAESAHEALEALAHAGAGQGGPAAFALLDRIEQAVQQAGEIDACCGKLAAEHVLRVRTRLDEVLGLSRRLVGRVDRFGRKRS